MKSFVGLHEVAAHTASKSGVAGLTRALAVEWGPRGVTVNAIAPGVFHTSLNSTLLDETGRGKEFLPAHRCAPSATSANSPPPAFSSHQRAPASSMVRF